MADLLISARVSAGNAARTLYLPNMDAADLILAEV